jgi:transglutaminase-like putative cysteine protease
MLGAILVIGLFWNPDGGVADLVEQGSKLIAVVIFAWVLYLGLIAGGDVLEPGIALLFVLLAGEALRPLDAPNDFRLYSLSLALVIAATAYYPGVAFGIAFTAYVVLATLALMVGHLRRQADRFRIADLRIDRSFLAVTAALSVITLLASVVIFVAFPRMPRSWFGQGRAQTGNVTGFSDVVSLGEHGGRIEGNPAVMFRVEFEGDARPDPAGMYWRGLSFDRFDGIRWSRDAEGRADASRVIPSWVYATRWGPVRQEYQIFGGPPGVRVLFAQQSVLGVHPHSAIRPWLRNNGDIEYRGWDTPVYSVRSGPSTPTDVMLRAAPDDEPEDARRYLQLPRLDPRVARLADSLTAPHAARIDRVRAVERWLSQELSYTLDLPRTSRQASLEHFLFERRAGHCEYFSTAMAVLLRSVGIPARNVNGFLGGEWNERGGYLAVTGNNAHSWVEVWFGGLGWVRFDGTPAADREETLLAAGTSRLWPMLFWIDGMQFQWYRWVMAYDLSRQMDLLAAIGERFAPAASAAGRPAPIDWRRTIMWILAGVGAMGLLWLATRQRAQRHPPGTRLYLELRRSYSRAGYPVPPAEPPLAFLEHLRREQAPGVADSERIVTRYLQARFGHDELNQPERRAMEERLASVRRALRE